MEPKNPLASLKATDIRTKQKAKSSEAESASHAGTEPVAPDATPMETFSVLTPQPSLISWDAVTAWGTIALGLATLILIAATWYGTEKTLQTEIEEKLMPIVILAVEPHSGDLVVQNIGFGPALNSGDIILTQGDHKGDESLDFFHVAALQPGQSERIGVVKQKVGTPGRVSIANSDEVANELKRLFPDTVSAPEPGKGKEICLSYSNANSEWYETRQRIRFSDAQELKGLKGIIIVFESRMKVGTVGDACK